MKTNKVLYTTQIGAPKLPVIQRTYVLPAGSIVTNVNFTNSGKTLVGSNLNLYPSQPPCIIGKPCPEFVAPDPAIYNATTPYPEKTATITNDTNPFGYHLVTVSFCPFEYIPKDKKLYRFNQVNMTIQYSIGNVEYQVKISEKRQKIISDYIRGSVVNPSAISNSFRTSNQVVNAQVLSPTTDKLIIPWKPSAYGSVPDYIIITNNALKSNFEPFATYKTQKGIPTLLVTVEQIYQNYPGCDNPEKIRNYLKATHQFWGAGLFVLLGGDTAIVPSRIGQEYTLNHTDLYYCDVYKTGNPNYNWNSNGDSNFGFYSDIVELGPDNFIGRAPVDTALEVQNFVSKVISYENLTGVTNTSYVNNMLFLGAYPNYNTPYIGSFDSSGQRWHRLLADQPFLGNPVLKKHLLFDDYLGSAHNNYLGNEELSRATTLDRLNNGFSAIGKFHLVSHYDHGGIFGLGTSGAMKNDGIIREDMDALSNGNNYQIMYSTACEDGEFQYDCFAEHYVNATNGGGVAMIANSGSVGYHNENQGTNLFNSIYGNLSPTSYVMGVAFANARDAYIGFNSKVLTLFGEPTMATWSATPQNITLTVQPSVTINNTIANILPVIINALTNDATVTLYKYNTVTQSIEIYASQIVTAGNTTTQFTLNPDTAGIMTVKVTAKNYLPAMANVNIILPQAHLYVTGYTIVDSNGNGFVEQGESVSLSVNLTNSGNTSINLINTVLSCNPIFANVTNSTVGYSLINAGQTVTLTGYSFIAQTANGTVLLPDFIEFFLNITANGSYTHLDNFYLDLKNPVLNLGARTLTNDSGSSITSFTLNENVNLNAILKNIGNVATGNLTATLSSPLVAAGYIAITNATSTYSSINVFGERQNNTPFVFKLLLPHSGDKIFTLTLTNPFGKTWSFDFDLEEPLPPLIANFRFTSKKDEIKVMWNPITNIQGYNVFRSNTENGVYTKLNNLLITGSAMFNDVGLAVRTAYYYKVSVVTLSGNELPLTQVVTNHSPTRQGYKAWTSLDTHQAFPIDASGSNTCYSSPTLYDVDGNGRKEIFINNTAAENLGKTMGFYDSGQEMYNIDGNVTTVSGFVATNIAMKSNSAVGDLDNDGHAEVLSMGRNNDTNQGLLHVYKTVDANGDNRPDKFWANEIIDFGWRAWRNPVLYDIDGNGFLDIIVVDEHQKVYVYDKDKNIMPGWPIQVPGADYSQGHIAVADLDHDGKGEIAIGLQKVNGLKGGIYIWNHDGTPFTTNPFKEFADNERADSGIVFADINNDLNLDILINTRIGNTIGKMYAFKQDGTPVDTNWNGTNTFSLTTGAYTDHLIPRIAVGDLNHDGNLEIAYGSCGSLYLLDRYGNNVTGFPKVITDVYDNAPVLADIDGDSDAEILINDNGKLIAFEYDGSDCVGYPLESQNGSLFEASPSIADLDNDGKNEIVISTRNASTYVYKSDGHSDRIEWGSYRGNPQNTGTEVCNNILDLMVRDGLTDVGDEPNNITPYMWTSPDIWIRNVNDGIYSPQNAEYSPSAPNFAYVRVTNKSCVTTTGTEQVTLYWAKAGISFDWPDTWDGNHYFPAPNNTVRTGMPVGTMSIPVLQPGQSTVISFPFMVPDPSVYSGINAIEPWHYCMLARVEATNDPSIETIDLYQNVKNNNNLGWVNFSIIDVVPDSTQSSNGSNNGAIVAVGNPFNEPHSFFIEIVKEDLETGKDIYEEAEVSIKMNDVLYNAWERGGKDAEKIEATLDERKKIVRGNHVILDNLLFEAKEMGTLSLKFNFLTKELTDKTKFVYHVIQKDAQNGNIIGGETYIIRKEPRPIFEADAGGDKEVDANQPITISAAQISEPAIYNWYDSEGNLIFTGKDLQIANAIAEKYKLEVISTVDGFKDYSEMEVKINPNKLKNIVPNTVSENTKIYYNLKNANSAYLMIVSYYMNGGISNNYVLDLNSSETTINFSSYPSGFYKVILIANGVPSGMKIIYKQ